jgi:hypothetical protein
VDAGEETRDAGGRFLPGKSGNPCGTARTWQPFGVRCQHWLDKMTRAELRALAKNESEMDKLSSYDSMVITALVGAQTGSTADRGKERERVLDRIEGKPKQSTELTGKDGAELFGINIHKGG